MAASGRISLTGNEPRSLPCIPGLGALVGICDLRIAAENAGW